MGDLIALKDIPVLVCTPDHGFLCVTTFLLGRRQFRVQTASTLFEVMEHVDRERADLVLFDADIRPERAAEAARALASAERPIGALFVADGVSGSAAVPLSDKWAALERLPASLTRLYARVLNVRSWSANRSASASHRRLLAEVPRPITVVPDAANGVGERTSRVVLGAS